MPTPEPSLPLSARLLLSGCCSPSRLPRCSSPRHHLKKENNKDKKARRENIHRRVAAAFLPLPLPPLRARLRLHQELLQLRVVQHGRHVLQGVVYLHEEMILSSGHSPCQVQITAIVAVSLAPRGRGHSKNGAREEGAVLVGVLMDRLGRLRERLTSNIWHGLRPRPPCTIFA